MKKPSPTLSHKMKGDFPSLDFVVSSVERWEGLGEGVIFSISKLAFSTFPCFCAFVVNCLIINLFC